MGVPGCGVAAAQPATRPQPCAMRFAVIAASLALLCSPTARACDRARLLRRSPLRNCTASVKRRKRPPLPAYLTKPWLPLAFSTPRSSEPMWSPGMRLRCATG